MPDVKISAGADPVTLVATDKVPLARSASTTAYAATMAEIATWANTNLPVASTSVSGTVRVDGSSITIAGGIISAPGAGVSTFNTRAGAVVLQQSDLTAVGALHDVGRNLLHNSMFNVAQRGAGPWSTSGYTADRWIMSVNLDTITVTLNTSGAGLSGDESLRRYLTAGVTGSASVGSYSQLEQRIEDVSRLAGKTVTVSFGANAGAGTPKIGMRLVQLFGTGGSPSAAVYSAFQYVTLSTTQARYSLTFSVPSIIGKTLGTNGDHSTSLSVFFSLQGDATLGVQTANISLWGIQLEIGSVATPLEKPDPRYDLANCQRFYQTVWVNSRVNASAVQQMSAAVYWSIMRASPTVALGTTGVRTNVSSVALIADGPSAGRVNCQSNAAGDAFVLDEVWTLSADL